MASLKTAASAVIFLASAAHAHFNLMTPPTIGFNDDNEGMAPCGGFTPDFSNPSSLFDFHVGGEPVALTLGHSQANWLFRGTLDTTANGNWTQLFPIVQQSGLGLFCETAVPAPESWVGKQGVVGVVANAVDGLLYQCAAVNFVAGTGTVGSTCTNGTVQAAFMEDATLSALVGPSSSSNATTTPSPSQSPSSSASPSPSPSGNAAAGLGPTVSCLISAVALSLVGLVGL